MWGKVIGLSIMSTPLVGTFLILRHCWRKTGLSADMVCFLSCGIFFWSMFAFEYYVKTGRTWCFWFPLLFAVTQTIAASLLEDPRKGFIQSTTRVIIAASSYLLFFSMGLQGKVYESVARKLACDPDERSLACQEHESPRHDREVDCAEDLKGFCDGVDLRNWYSGAGPCLREHFLHLRPRCRRHLY